MLSDEEKAEEYINKNPSAKILCPFEEGRIRRVKDALLYGLAEGRKEKWHDLRKDPNDLPSSKTSTEIPVLLAYKSAIDGEIVVEEYIYIDDEGFIGLESYYQGDYREPPYYKKEGSLIAWCELPKFKE